MICSVIGGFLYGFFALLIELALGTRSLFGVLVRFVTSGFVFAIVDLIGVFLWAEIVHSLVRAYVRPNAEFEASFRVAAYSSVIIVLGGWIPLVNVLAGLYNLFLGITGIREVHSTTTGRAVRCFILFIVLYVLLVLGVVAAIVVPLLAAS